MKVDTARTAQSLIPQIDEADQMVADVQEAIDGEWRLVEMVAESREGKRLHLLPTGTATPEMSALALSQAKKFYESKLAALNEALAAL